MSTVDVYGVCPCGYYERAPFGDLRHIHTAVCPRCGKDTGYMNLVTGRAQNVGTFWRPKYRVVALPESSEQADG